MNNSKKLNTRTIAGCGVLIGVAVILQYIEIAIPVMPSFVKLDLSDLPEIIGAFAYGPLAGVIITVLKNVIHLLASQSGFVGELSNAILGSTFCLVAGLIYEGNKTKKNAIIGGIVGAIAMAIISYPVNLYIIYPMYIIILNFPEVAILGMYQVINPNVSSLSEALLMFNVPFTLVKGLIDVFLCTLIYKRISPILKGNEKTMLYSLVGKVIHGLGLGHKHGMPTANIELKDKNVKCGVYAGIVTIDNKQHYCVTNVGNRPSIDNDKTIKVESYILDFNENIYNKEIKIDLYYYLRDIKKFNNIDEVIEQANKDVVKAKEELNKIIKL